MCRMCLHCRPTEPADSGSGVDGEGGPTTPEYCLYGVLVHQGLSAQSGHYYAFVQAPGACLCLHHIKCICVGTPREKETPHSQPNKYFRSHGCSALRFQNDMPSCKLLV